VELIEEPLDINKDIFEILKDKLVEVKGIYLTGSYARGDNDKDSDVDVLVITESSKGNIKKGRYDLLLIPYENLEDALRVSLFPILPMIKEAVPILNQDLILPYKNVEIDKGLIQKKVKNIKEALSANQEIIELNKEAEQEKIGDGVAYSLVLRLRELYMLDCLIAKKRWCKKGLIDLVKKVSGSAIAYERYLKFKNNNKDEDKLPIVEAERLLEYLKKVIKEWDKIKK